MGRVFRGLGGVESAVVEGVDFDEDEQLVLVRARVPARDPAGRTTAIPPSHHQAGGAITRRGRLVIPPRGW
jgi:hypothetical protein